MTMPRPVLLLKVILPLALALGCFQGFSQMVYWTEPGTGRLMYADLTPGNIQGSTQLATVADGPGRIALDPGNDRIFYTVWGGEDIHAADINDGSLMSIVITTGAMVGHEVISYSENADAVFAVMNEEVRGIYVIPGNNEDSGSEYTLDLGIMSNDKFLGVAVDDGSEEVYFTSDDTPGLYSTPFGGGGAIFRANPADVKPAMVAVDKATGVVYFTAEQTSLPYNTLLYSYTPSTNTLSPVLADLGNSQVFALQVYSQFNRVYFVQDDALKSVTLSGGSPVTLVTSGVQDFGILPDVTDPMLLSLAPANNATNVPLTTDLTLEFTEDVKIATAAASTDRASLRLYRASDNALIQTITKLSGDITISGNEVTIAAAALGDLQPSTAYYIQIGDVMFTDLSNRTYAGINTTTTWRFTTMPGVTITKPTASLCGAGYITLPDIVIEEASPGNFAAGSASFTLGFVGSTSAFQPGQGTATIITGRDIAAASVTVTATAVTVTYYVSTTTNLDRLTISGLRISTTDPSLADDIIRTGGTAVVAGLYNGDVVAELTAGAVVAPPAISYPSSNNHYCKDASLSGTVVTVTGTDVRWYGAADLTVTYPPLDGQNSVTGDELTISSAVPGTFSRYVTQTVGACESASSKVDIIIDPLPVPTFTSGVVNACVGASVTYATQSSMTNYVWTVSAGGTITAGGTATSNSVTVTWNSTGAQTVTVNYSNANGCTAAAPVTRSVTVNPLPVPPLNGNNTACVGATGVVYSTTASMTNYVWTVSAGGTITAGGTATSETATVTWNTPGLQTVSVNFTNANGCTGAAPTIQNVTINAAPTISLTGPTSVCAGATSVVYNTEAGQSNYNWVVSGGGTIAAGGTASSDFVEVVWNSTGSRTVSVNYNNALGCAALLPQVLNVTVVAEPTTPLAGDDQVVCGATATLEGNTATVGTGQWTVVTGTGGSFSNDASPTATFTGTVGSTYVLRWTISSANCTAKQDEVSITLQPAPTTAVAGTTQNICGTSTTLAANTPATGTGAWSIQSGAGGNVTTLSSATSTFTGIAGNSYVLRWTISNGVCPVSQSDVTINFFGTPTTSVAGTPQTLCGTSTTLAANTATTGTGLWTIDNGTGGTFGNSASPTSTFTGVAGTTYTLRWTISNGGCTPSSSTVSIGLVANPTTALAGPDQQPCGITTTLAGNTPSVGTGSWSVINGAGGAITTPSSPTSGFTGNAGVLYTLRWTISNTGCPSSSEDVDIVFIEPPTTARAGDDINVCGTITNLAGNIATSGLGTWSVINGAGGQIVNPGSATSVFNGVAGATYTLRWTITKTGCTASSDEVTVQLRAVPSGTGSVAGLASICPGVTTTYQVNGLTNATGYEWNIPSGFELVSQSGTSADIKAVSGSGGAISVTGVSECGRTNPAGLDVAILPAPPISIQLPGNAVIDDELSFSFTAAGAVSNPTWSFGDDGTASGTNPTHTYTQPGDYEIVLLVDDGIGCKGRDAQTLKVLPEAELSNYSIKNVVTANGDERNGVLYIDRIERFPESEVVVLDRWGVEVYRKINYANDWDFRKGEEFVPAGSYVCLVKYQGKIYSRNVTVLKGK